MTHHSQTSRSRMRHRPITQGKPVHRALLIAAIMPSLTGRIAVARAELARAQTVPPVPARPKSASAQ